MLLRDPDVAGFGSFTGSTRRRPDRQYRALLHRAQAARRAQAHRLARSSTGCGRSLRKVAGRHAVPAADAGHHRGRPHRRAAAFSTRCRIPTSPSSTNGRRRCWTRCARCRSSPTSSSDLLANAPQLKITINRDQAVALRHLAADDRRHAQRRLRPAPDHAVFHPAQDLLRSSSKSCPSCRGDLASLDRLYVKSPLTGGAVPLSTLVDVDPSKVGPLSVAHQGQFPAVTLTLQPAPRRCARRGGRRDRAGRARDRHAVLGDRRPSRATPRRSSPRCRASRR